MIAQDSVNVLLIIVSGMHIFVEIMHSEHEYSKSDHKVRILSVW
jgi:hypothetical protein